MSLKSKKQEWISPDILGWGYLNLISILRGAKIFARMTSEQNMKEILDMGCGIKPYESLFTNTNLIGFDIEKNDQVDVVGVNWDLPFDDNRFDAIICTQVFEHTAEIEKTVKEIKRVTKKNGLVYVSAPLAYPEHGAPFDYYRFTQYGLLHIFKGFEFIKIMPQGGYINTMLRLTNTLLNYLPGAKYFLFPIYFINNIISIGTDATVEMLGSLNHDIFKKIHRTYFSFPENYSIIIKNIKE